MGLEKKIWKKISKSDGKDEVKISCHKSLLKPEFDKFMDVISKSIKCKGEAFDLMIALKFKIITVILEGEKMNWSQ